MVELAYLFGSRVSGDVGPLSDYDIAIYTQDMSVEDLTDLRLQLAGELSRLLSTDAIDLVVLNNSDVPALNYSIIVGGKLLFDRSNIRMLVEPKILNEYFDLQMHHQIHGLTSIGATI